MAPSASPPEPWAGRNAWRATSVISTGSLSSPRVAMPHDWLYSRWPRTTLAGLGWGRRQQWTGPLCLFGPFYPFFLPGAVVHRAGEENPGGEGGRTPRHGSSKKWKTPSASRVPKAKFYPNNPGKMERFRKNARRERAWGVDTLCWKGIFISPAVALCFHIDK